MLTLFTYGCKVTHFFIRIGELCVKKYKNLPSYRKSQVYMFDKRLFFSNFANKM
jgi:hypothetical protein